MSMITRWVQHQAVAGPVFVPPSSPTDAGLWVAARAVFPDRAPARRAAPLGTFVVNVEDVPDIPPPPDATEIRFTVYPDRIDRQRGLHASQQMAVSWNPFTPDAYLVGSAQAFYPDRLTRDRPRQQPDAVTWHPDTPVTPPVVFDPVWPVYPNVVLRQRTLPISQQQAVWTPSQSGSAVVTPTTLYTVRRLRRAPYVSGIDRGWIFFEQFQLDMEVGTGSLTAAPLAELRWSNDKGNTWTTPISTSFGLEGEYRTRVIWRRLGKGRDRIFEVAMTETAKVVIVDAFLELKGGKR